MRGRASFTVPRKALHASYRTAAGKMLLKNRIRFCLRAEGKCFIIVICISLYRENRRRMNLEHKEKNGQEFHEDEYEKVCRDCMQKAFDTVTKSGIDFGKFSGVTPEQLWNGGMPFGMWQTAPAASKEDTLNNKRETEEERKIRQETGEEKEIPQEAGGEKKIRQETGAEKMMRKKSRTPLRAVFHGGIWDGEFPSARST